MSENDTTITEVTPNRISEIGWAFTQTRVLVAGVQLGVFDHIASGSHNAEQIAAQAKASLRGMRMLLDALAALGLLVKEGSSYRLSPESAKYLVHDSPTYIGSTWESDSLSHAWNQLTEVVHTGMPVWRVNEAQQGQSYFVSLIKRLHITNRAAACRLADLILSERHGGGLKVLDVGCGSGVWSISLAERDETIRVTAQDFPEVLETTRQYTVKHGVERQFDYLPGDLNEVELGADHFDLVLLGNIVHSEGERSSRAFFKRIVKALKANGQLIIIDMIPNDDRTGPLFPLLFGINMLVNTKEGGVYTFQEYQEWLTEAGFNRIEKLDIGLHSPAIRAEIR